jgi:Protein of unknown function (DUF3307)
MTLEYSTLFAPFLLVAALQAKHVICDGPLQTLAMVKDKSHYLRPLGVAHSAIHGVASFFVLLLFKFDPLLALATSAAEFAVHYHIDFIKENTVKLFRWTIADGPFWWAQTLDQALHHFTYLVIAFMLFRL